MEHFSTTTSNTMDIMQQSKHRMKKHKVIKNKKTMRTSKSVEAKGKRRKPLQQIVNNTPKKTIQSISKNLPVQSVKASTTATAVNNNNNKTHAGFQIFKQEDVTRKSSDSSSSRVETSSSEKHVPVSSKAELRLSGFGYVGSCAGHHHDAIQW